MIRVYSKQIMLLLSVFSLSLSITGSPQIVKIAATDGNYHLLVNDEKVKFSTVNSPLYIKK